MFQFRVDCADAVYLVVCSVIRLILRCQARTTTRKRIAAPQDQLLGIERTKVRRVVTVIQEWHCELRQARRASRTGIIRTSIARFAHPSIRR